MRELADASRIRRFMEAWSREADAPARVYFTGGATAVLMGWRATTIDVDVKLVPETDRLLRAIPRLKEDLRLNVELASPADFIPVPAGWEDRSAFIAQEGALSADWVASWMLHLDDPRAKVRQQLRGIGAGDVAGEIQHGQISECIHGTVAGSLRLGTESTLAITRRIPPTLDCEWAATGIS